MHIKYIVVSIGRGYGIHTIDKEDCGLMSDLTFSSNLLLAKQFDSKEEALIKLEEIYKERKNRGFRGNFFIREIICC